MGNKVDKTRGLSISSHGTLCVTPPDGSGSTETFDREVWKGRVVQDEKRVVQWDPAGNHRVFLEGFDARQTNSTVKDQMAQEENVQKELSNAARMMKTVSDFFSGHFKSEVTISRNSTVTVTSPYDGTTVTAHKEELEKNGELQKAVHRVESTPSPKDPHPETKVWERQYSEKGWTDTGPHQTPRNTMLTSSHPEQKQSVESPLRPSWCCII